MAKEFGTLLQNHTWTLVPFDSHKNVVGGIRNYCIKYHVDVPIEHYNAQIIAHGFHQQPWIDYHETFSLTVRLFIVRLILSLAFSSCFSFWQLDVNNDFFIVS